MRQEYTEEVKGFSEDLLGIKVVLFIIGIFNNLSFCTVLTY